MIAPKETANLTYGILMNYHNQLETERRTGSVYYFLNRSKIQSFYSDYGIRIKTAFDDMQKIKKTYFEVDEKGFIITEEVEGKKQGKMLEGKNIEDYNKEINIVLMREVLAK